VKCPVKFQVFWLNNCLERRFGSGRSNYCYNRDWRRMLSQLWNKLIRRVAELTKLLMQLKRCHTIRFSGSDKFFSLWWKHRCSRICFRVSIRNDWRNRKETEELLKWYLRIHKIGRSNCSALKNGWSSKKQFKLRFQLLQKSGSVSVRWWWWDCWNGQNAQIDCGLHGRWYKLQLTFKSFIEVDVTNVKWREK
jgi:hypothetical protein